jgi:hypothetical protein
MPVREGNCHIHGKTKFYYYLRDNGTLRNTFCASCQKKHRKGYARESRGRICRVCEKTDDQIGFDGKDICWACRKKEKRFLESGKERSLHIIKDEKLIKAIDITGMNTEEVRLATRKARNIADNLSKKHNIKLSVYDTLREDLRTKPKS